MKKIFVLSLLSLMVLPLAVQADYDGMMDSGGMMNYGSMWGGGWIMTLLALTYFAVFSFVFSLIFWLVQKWINKK